MKCGHCGCELPDTAKFCRSCGTNKFNGTVTSNNIQPTIETFSASSAASQEAPTLIPSASQPVIQIQGSEQPKKVQPAAEVRPELSAIPEALPTKPKAKTVIYAAIGILVITLLSGTGYWGWTQKKASDEQAARLAQQQADELKRKADEELDQKLKMAEEKGRAETEEKAKQVLDIERFGIFFTLILYPFGIRV